MLMKLNLFFFSILLSTGAFAQTCYDMLAGQTINIGKVCISNDENNLYVRYSSIEQWLLNETHLFVGESLDAMPATKKGNPKIGNFPYKLEDINTNYAEFIVPLASIGSPACDTDLYVAAHASAQQLLNDGSYQQETSWSDGERFVEKGNWGTYSIYVVTCDDPPPPPGDLTCETAFAVGDTTFVDLGLTNKRWGWEITELAPGNYSYQIYAGAGQNDLSKGTYVGDLSVDYDGSSVTVSYQMLTGFIMEETHLYVGTEHIDTIAPGQYGNIHDLTLATSDSYTIDGFSGENLFIVAHAVTCE